MAGEVATQGTVGQVVRKIKAEMEATQDPKELALLKKLGRFSLTLFDWSTPEWAKEYQELFKE